MVLDPIPENERCTCEPKIEKEGKQYVSLPSSFAIDSDTPTAVETPLLTTFVRYPPQGPKP